ncbi:MAG: HD domain-containing protein [Nitrospirae bacterium]|nr:HD domain-containing protein [Nitrospirota bacterium]
MKRLDDVFIEKIIKHGKGVITNFSILVKITGIYDSMNEAIINTTNRLIAELTPLLGEEGEVTLKMAEDSFFIEDTRIKATLSDLDTFNSLMKELKKKGIGVITFKSPLMMDDLIYLAYALKGGEGASQVQSTLESKLTKGVSIGGPVFARKEDSIDLRDTRLIARRSYTRVLASITEAYNALKTGKPVNIKKAKRSIQSLVDCMLKDESYVLGFTTLRDVNDYIYNHSVNVAIFSIGIGKRTGITKYHLGLLGMSALLHDIGTVEIPLTILNKSSDLSKGEMELMKRHPVEGVHVLLRSKGLNEISIISMLVSYEHHLNLDLSGYPVVPDKREVNLFSQIISIADEYDAMVSGKVYGRIPYSPREALKIIYNKSDKQLNPVLTKVFINMLEGNGSGTQ